TPYLKGLQRRAANFNCWKRRRWSNSAATTAPVTSRKKTGQGQARHYQSDLRFRPNRGQFR
ncbi:hypothetical protein PgNI_10695, partial [Pyricularia grisea]|uniref:Uncharacterized protein n=1 Tax=Pyricularia grisea TaxID=148305 RepID=A0A6P8AYF5_PYRGI